MTKNPWAISEREVALARLDDFVDEADGHMRLYVIRYNNKELAQAARKGDTLAIALAMAIDSSLRQISEDTPRCCLACTHEFSPDTTVPPHAFAIWVPRSDGDKPEHLLTQPICAECCRRNNDKQLLDEALVFIKKLWPETEEIGEECIDE